jgi:hypothetical protein
VRIALCAVGAYGALQVHGWIGYVALLTLALLQGRAPIRAPVLVSAALAVLAATMVTHAVFFGAGRYALVTFPLLSGLAAFAAARQRPPDRSVQPALAEPWMQVDPGAPAEGDARL